MTKQKRAALYLRVSTDHQSVENQNRELRQIAERRRWIVVEVYSDAGISGAKRRDQRPGLDAMLKDVSRRKFDVVMAWAIDGLGPLIGRPARHHRAPRGLSTSTSTNRTSTTTSPMGKLGLQITGSFAEFERGMIRQRVRAGLKTIKSYDRARRQVHVQSRRSA